MPDILRLDDRIYNPYAVEDLSQSHPRVHAAFQAWFRAVADFEEGPLLQLIAARGPEEVGRHRVAAEAALAQLPECTKHLSALVAALDNSLAGESPGAPRHARLTHLLQSARHNQRELERAPVLAAAAIASAENYAAAVPKAEALVKATAEKLEAMAKASSGRTKMFADLRPMIGDLRQVKQQLGAGFSDLSRQDVRRVGGAEKERMQKATATLCKNLLSAKARARAAGLLPPLEIKANGDGVADRFATALLRSDYQAASACLAPWLGTVWTPELLKSRIEAEYSSAARDAGISSAPAAAEYQASTNSIDLPRLREIHDGSKSPIPAEVTAKNFLAWVPLQLLPEEEDSYLTDIDYLILLYLLTVRDGKDDRIGYLLFADE